MRELSSEGIKENIFNILICFSEYCDRHGIRYFLCGGTLLGAVRHKGFIPWDDDIDVMLPRPDFDRFHELIKTEPLSEYYKVIGLNAGETYTPFSKIIDTRTEIEIRYANNDRNLWIDLFPMDGVPDDEEECAQYLKKAYNIKMSYTRSNAKIGDGKSRLRAVLKIPMLLVMKMFGIAYFGKKADKFARQLDFDKCDFVAGVAWSLGPQERMEKAKYLPSTDLEFNGRMFHAPYGWDHYLSNLYGDYMTLPPEDQRTGHEYKAYIRD